MRYGSHFCVHCNPVITFKVKLKCAVNMLEQDWIDCELCSVDGIITCSSDKFYFVPQTMKIELNRLVVDDLDSKYSLQNIQNTAYIPFPVELLEKRLFSPGSMKFTFLFSEDIY